MDYSYTVNLILRIDSATSPCEAWQLIKPTQMHIFEKGHGVSVQFDIVNGGSQHHLVPLNLRWCFVYL